MVLGTDPWYMNFLAGMLLRPLGLLGTGKATEPSFSLSHGTGAEGGVGWHCVFFSCPPKPTPAPLVKCPHPNWSVQRISARVNSPVITLVRPSFSVYGTPPVAGYWGYRDG